MSAGMDSALQNGMVAMARKRHRSGSIKLMTKARA